MQQPPACETQKQRIVSNEVSTPRTHPPRRLEIGFFMRGREAGLAELQNRDSRDPDQPTHTPNPPANSPRQHLCCPSMYRVSISVTTTCDDYPPTTRQNVFARAILLDLVCRRYRCHERYRPCRVYETASRSRRRYRASCRCTIRG